MELMKLLKNLSQKRYRVFFTAFDAMDINIKLLGLGVIVECFITHVFQVTGNHITDIGLTFD